MRHGTTSLFAAFEVQTGRVIGQCHPRHSFDRVSKFLEQIEGDVPADIDICLILDNYGKHKTAAIRGWLAKRPRFHLHLTGASWISRVERWFAALTEMQIDAVRIGARVSWRRPLSGIEHSNQDSSPFVWTKSADEILERLARFCKQTSDSGR